MKQGGIAKPLSGLAQGGMAVVALMASVGAQAAPNYVSEYGRLLTELDYPGGKPYINFSLDSTKLKGAWAAAAPALTFTEVPEPASRDRSRVIHRYISGTKLVPEAAVKAMRYSFPKSGTEGPTGWHEYWVKTRVEPINGASTELFYSQVERRLVQCEPGGILVGGSLYFASLDASGEAYQARTFYDEPRVLRDRYLVIDERLRTELRQVCQPILAAALGEEEARQRLEQMLKLPDALALLGGSRDELEKRAVLGAQVLAAFAAQPASGAASGAAAASDAASTAAPAVSPAQASASAALPAASAASDAVPEPKSVAGLVAAAAAAAAAEEAPPLPLGQAKARVRMFAQNGIGAGLSDRAACETSQSGEAGGSGLWKALASTFHVSSSVSIGMPETETTRKLSDRSVLASKAYYTERDITADMPVTVDFSFGSPGSGNYCPRIVASFIPYAGGDYEAVLDVGGGRCVVTVSRILANGNLWPVQLTSAPSCPPQKQ